MRHTSDNYNPISVIVDVQSGYLCTASKAELKRVIVEGAKVVYALREENRRLKDKNETK